MLNNKNKKRGFSLIVVSIILMTMFAGSLALSVLVLRTTRGVRSMLNSERAYYAAETAAERILYKVNKNYEDITSISLSGSINGADYGNDTLNPDLVSSFSQTLTDGKSLELSFDLNGATYPSSLNIKNLTETGGKVILLAFKKTTHQPDNQEIYTLPASSPSFTTLYFDWANYYYKIRIINDTGDSAIFQIYPSSGTFPLGLIISTWGKKGETKRILQTYLYKWQVF